MFHEQRTAENKLIQFPPARAKKKLIIAEVNAAHASYALEQKIDGERYEIQTYRPCNTYLHGCTSRRESEVTGRFVEKTDRVPHISNHPQLPQRSMLDCEFVSSGDMILKELPGPIWDKLTEPSHPHMMWLKAKFGGALPCYPHVSNTVSIMGSLGPEAVRKQEERGWIWAYCFDIPLYTDRNLCANTQQQRRRFLASQMEKIDPELCVLLMPQWQGLTPTEIEFMFYLITEGRNEDERGEGLILKDPTQPYNGPRNWYKIKRDYPVDCVLTGRAKEGEHGKTGKMLGMASSLEIGVYDRGILQPVGWVSAIMDGFHNLVPIHMAEETFGGKVIEARHNGTQDDPTSPLGITLRHPRFRRRRDDKNATDCTLAALLEEIANVPKG